MSLLIVGTAALDTVETPFGKVKEVLGGSGVYAAAAASFFSAVNFVSVVGQDFPRKFVKFLTQRKIDLSGLEKQKGRTFRWAGFYDFDLSTAKTLFTELNVLENFAPVLPPKYRQSELVLLANLSPEVQISVIKQLKKPRLVVLDTMNFWIKNTRKKLMEAIKLVGGLILNEGEARELTKLPSLIQAGRRLLGWGPRFVIIKKGEHGALLFTKNSFFSAPSYPLEEIKDPTGAGDSFAGGLVGYLARTGDLSEKNLRRAIIIGSIIASFNVEDFSLNRLKRLKISEICGRFEEFKKFAHFEELELKGTAAF